MVIVIGGSRIAGSTGCIGSQNTGYLVIICRSVCEACTVSPGTLIAINLPLVSGCCPAIGWCGCKVDCSAGTNRIGIGCNGNTDRKIGSTVMVMELDVAGLPVAQVALEVRIQVTHHHLHRSICECGTVCSCIHTINLPLISRCCSAIGWCCCESNCSACTNRICIGCNGNTDRQIRIDGHGNCIGSSGLPVAQLHWKSEYRLPGRFDRSISDSWHCWFPAFHTINLPLVSRCCSAIGWCCCKVD
jgi:hypothetical protein